MAAQWSTSSTRYGDYRPGDDSGLTSPQLVKVLRLHTTETFADVWESLTTFCTYECYAKLSYN